MAVLTERTLVICVSQSGESAEPVRVAQALAARDRRPTLVPITNGTGNSLAGVADIALDTHAGEEHGPSTMTFAATLVVLRELAHALGARSGAPEAYAAAAAGLERLATDAPLGRPPRRLAGCPVGACDHGSRPRSAGRRDGRPDAQRRLPGFRQNPCKLPFGMAAGARLSRAGCCGDRDRTRHRGDRPGSCRRAGRHRRRGDGGPRDGAGRRRSRVAIGDLDPGLASAARSCRCSSCPGGWRTCAGLEPGPTRSPTRSLPVSDPPVQGGAHDRCRARRSAARRRARVAAGRDAVP